MSTAAIKLKFNYADNTSRTVEYSPFSLTNLSPTTIKNNIKAFNTSGVSAVEGLYISDNGAFCTGIGNASIAVTNETIIYGSD